MNVDLWNGLGISRCCYASNFQLRKKINKRRKIKPFLFIALTYTFQVVVVVVVDVAVVVTVVVAVVFVEMQ